MTGAPGHAQALRWLNGITEGSARGELTRCCGSKRWVERMLASRPFRDSGHLFTTAEQVWHELGPDDWLEAFSHHPRIGEKKVTVEALAPAWESEEQKGVRGAAASTLERLHQGNVDYEKKFGYIYLVCATGKSAEELLSILEARLRNDPAMELLAAAEEQNKITRIRLEKMLNERHHDTRS